MFTSLLYQTEGCEKHHNCDYYGEFDGPAGRDGG